MTKQTLEFDVPEGWELTGDYRAPEAKEYWLNADYEVCQTSVGQHHYPCPRPIVRKAWQWPEWLTASWIAMDKDGDWFAFKNKPVKSSSSLIWSAIDDDEYYSRLDTTFFDVVMPTCEDWTKSLRKNPHLGD